MKLCIVFRAVPSCLDEARGEQSARRATKDSTTTQLRLDATDVRQVH